MATSGISQLAGTLDLGGWFNTMMYWAGYGILILLFLGMLFGAYYMLTFNIKLHYWPVRGDINDNLSADKMKTNRLKWNKHRTAWKMLWPLFNKKSLEPFKNEYVYAGNSVYAFKVGEKFFPAELAVKDINRWEVQPIPYNLKEWHVIELKQNEQEFSKKGFWEENKYFFMVIITAVACCAVVGLTVYYTYQYANGQLHDAQTMVGTAIKAIETKAPN